MVFVTAIGFFIVPALLGGRRETMITQLIIEQVLQTLNWGFAGAISVLLLVVVLAVFALYDRVLGLSTHDRRRRPRAAKRASRGQASCAGSAMRILTSLGAACDRLLALLPRRRREAAIRRARSAG